TFVILLALGAALLALFAGWEAHRARRTAERLLYDYAVMIADKIVDGSTRRYYSAIGLWSPSSDLAEMPLGSLLQVHAHSMRGGRAAALRTPEVPAVRYAFVYDAGTARLVTSGVTPEAGERQELLSLLKNVELHCVPHCVHPFGRLTRLTGIPAAGDGEWGGLMETDETGELGWVYGVRLDPREAVASFVVPLILDSLSCRCPSTLLPASLSHLTDTRKAASFVVRDGNRRVLYSSEPNYGGVVTATAELSSDLPLTGVTVEVAVNPEVVRPLLPYGGRDAPWTLLVVISLMALGAAVLSIRSLRKEGELARARQDFVSSVSHELRTPLTRIRLFNELLSSGKQENADKRAHYHSVIDRECRRLTLLVDHLLHISRLERKPERRALSLRRVVERALEVFQAASDAATFRLSVEVEDVPPVLGDDHALQQVVINLLDNAVKYSPVGAPIEVRLTAKEGCAEISVMDRGQGIPEVDRKRIFDEFYRGPSAAAQSASGNGLGLALVRRAVQAHQGEVIVESSIGDGSTFRVRIPLVSTSSEGRVAPS
ncbi:MAG: HAMP domain-containing histidine kinase, partial [Vicinamibacteria bacterium]|nr:HAMP domain-containing histidine kinase [Vicinamibacteria bacterium]